MLGDRLRVQTDSAEKLQAAEAKQGSAEFTASEATARAKVAEERVTAAEARVEHAEHHARAAEAAVKDAIDWAEKAEGCIYWVRLVSSEFSRAQRAAGPTCGVKKLDRPLRRPFASRPTRHQTAQMLWSIRCRLLCLLLPLLVRCGIDELDLETVVLHHQLKVLRRGGRRVLFTTADRAFLAAAARVLSRHRWKSFPGRPGHAGQMALGPPEEKKRSSRPPGRPPLDPSIKHLILRLARENPRWGYLRIRGELLKLGVDVSATTIATMLREGGLGPAPRRIGPTWTQFLRLQAYGLVSPGSPGEPSE